MIYVPRSRWGARHGLGLPTRAPQVRVVIHHAPERRLPVSPTHDEIAAHLRVIEQWHAEQLTPTQPRIGYHWIVVDQTGDIWEGLGWDRIGAHVAGHNTASLGILLLGLDGRESGGHPHTWQAVRRIIRQGISRGSLTPDPELAPHHRYVATTCPGNKVAAAVATLTLESTMPKPDTNLEGTLPRPHPPTRPDRVEAWITRPVMDVAKPGESTADFLRRIGGLLGPLLRPIWDALIARIIDRLERERDKVLDEILGPEEGR
jgi:peptidoglycan recognition protein